MLAGRLLLFAAVVLTVVGGAAAQPAPDMNGITFDAKYLSLVGTLKIKASVDLAKRGEFTALRYKCEYPTSESTGVALADQIDRDKFRPSVGTAVAADVEYSMGPEWGSARCTFVELAK